MNILASIRFLNLSFNNAIDEVLNRVFAGSKTAIVFGNSNSVVHAHRAGIVDWLNSEDVIVFNDGVAVDIANKLTGQGKFLSNLNGTDFVPALLERLKGRGRVFLIGGRIGVAEECGRILKERYGCEVVGTLDGFDGINQPNALDIVLLASPDLILVAMGNPRQEIWIKEHIPFFSKGVFVGVGALFDFISGRAKRAPLFIRFLRLEWLYRFLREPRRLFVRYFVDGWVFLYKVLLR